MNSSLKAFGVADPAFPLALTGTVDRRANNLHVRYVLEGPLKDLVLPEARRDPHRVQGLWNTTCFELFLAAEGFPAYWEFNLSPSGNWNVYRFESYRQGMTEEESFASLPFDVRRGGDSLTLSLNVDLRRIVRREQVLDVAVSAVTQGRDSSLTFWALVHRGERPDFHRREGFVIRLPV